jgi:hypothetical protein
MLIFIKISIITEIWTYKPTSCMYDKQMLAYGLLISQVGYSHKALSYVMMLRYVKYLNNSLFINKSYRLSYKSLRFNYNRVGVIFLMEYFVFSIILRTNRLITIVKSNVNKRELKPCTFYFDVIIDVCILRFSDGSVYTILVLISLLLYTFKAFRGDDFRF